MKPRGRRTAELEAIIARHEGQPIDDIAAAAGVKVHSLRIWARGHGVVLPGAIDIDGIRIAQPAAVRCHRFGCPACGYLADCMANVLAGGMCLGEARLVGEVV